MRGKALVLAFILLAGCEVGGGDSTVTVTGENLGDAVWRPVPRAQAKLAFPAATPLPVGEASARWLPNRYEERTALPGFGSVLLTVSTAGGFAATVPASEFSFVARDYTLDNVPLAPGGVPAAEIERQGDIAYYETAFRERPCVIFARPLGRLVVIQAGTYYDGIVGGSYCGPPGTNPAAVTAAVLDTVARLAIRR